MGKLAMDGGDLGWAAAGAALGSWIAGRAAHNRAWSEANQYYGPQIQGLQKRVAILEAEMRRRDEQLRIKTEELRVALSAAPKEQLPPNNKGDSGR